MNNEKQLSFDFDSSEDVDSRQETASAVAESANQYASASSEDKNDTGKPPMTEFKSPPLKPLAIKRALLGWLAVQNPSGMALNVPTRVSKYCADIAAFWSSPGKKHLMTPQQTMIIEIRRNREQCWPDCSRQEELLPLLRQKKAEKSSIEAEIRGNEPELKETDTLFPEYESWDYKGTKNRKYHKCIRQLEKIEHALYKGSRFEQIRRAYVADYLYLAVPAGTVLPEELADGWGLININSDMTVDLIKEAESWECPVENKLHLIQHIAAGCRKKLLFAMGVNLLASGRVSYSPPPKKRRAKKH